MIVSSEFRYECSASSEIVLSESYLLASSPSSSIEFSILSFRVIISSYSSSEMLQSGSLV